MAEDSSSRSSFSLSRFLSLEPAPENDEEDELNEYTQSVIEDEHLRVLLDKEADRNRIRQPHVDDSIRIARSEAIQWIFNTRLSLRFRFRTAYLSVTFIDRFISKSHITNNKPWMIRLLAVACLSLAAKLIDRTDWQLSSLLQLQVEGFMFSNNVIQRMELLVLSALDWRMHSITPFQFIGYFVSCFGVESTSMKRLVALISQIICAATIDLSLMEHHSSSIAMAATLIAMDQGLTRESMEMKVKTTWVNQLFDHAVVYACYSRMLELEPLNVNIFKTDVVKNEENPSKRPKHS